VDIFNDSSSSPLASSSVVRAVVASSLSSPQLENVSSNRVRSWCALDVHLFAFPSRTRFLWSGERSKARFFFFFFFFFELRVFPAFQSRRRRRRRVFLEEGTPPRILFIFVWSSFFCFFFPLLFAFPSFVFANKKKREKKELFTQKKRFSKSALLLCVRSQNSTTPRENVETTRADVR